MADCTDPYLGTHNGLEIDDGITKTQNIPTALEITHATKSANTGAAGLGRFYNLDGVAGFIDVANVPDITGDITIIVKARNKVAQTTASEMLVSRSNPSGNQRGYFLKLHSDGKLQMFIDAIGDQTTDSANVASDDPISDVDMIKGYAGVLSASTFMRLYTEAGLVGELTSGVPAGVHASTQDLEIGALVGTGFWNGEIFEKPMIFNVALTSDEIASILAGEPIPEKYIGAFLYTDVPNFTSSDWTANAVTKTDDDTLTLTAVAGSVFMPNNGVGKQVRIKMNVAVSSTLSGNIEVNDGLGGTRIFTYTPGDQGTDKEATVILTDINLQILLRGVAAEFADFTTLEIEYEGNFVNLDVFGSTEAFDSTHLDIVGSVFGADLNELLVSEVDPSDYLGAEKTRAITQALARYEAFRDKERHSFDGVNDKWDIPDAAWMDYGIGDGGNIIPIGIPDDYSVGDIFRYINRYQDANNNESLWLEGTVPQIRYRLVVGGVTKIDLTAVLPYVPVTGSVHSLGAFFVNGGIASMWWDSESVTLTTSTNVAGTHALAAAMTFMEYNGTFYKGEILGIPLRFNTVPTDAEIAVMMAGGSVPTKYVGAGTGGGPTLGNVMALSAKGHVQVLDPTHPDIIVTVTGATLVNIPAMHREKFVHKQAIDETPIEFVDILAAGYAVESLVTLGNSVTTPMLIGFSVSSTEILSDDISNVKKVYRPWKNSVGADEDFQEIFNTAVSLFAECPDPPGGECTQLEINMMRVEL
jgi:hypothetical protein